MITVTCECGQVLKVPVEYAGKSGRCVKCGRRVEIPAETPGLVFTGDGDTIDASVETLDVASRLFPAVRKELGEKLVHFEQQAIGEVLVIRTEEDRTQGVSMMVSDVYQNFLFVCIHSIFGDPDLSDNLELHELIESSSRSAVPMRVMVNDEGEGAVSLCIPFLLNELPSPRLLAICASEVGTLADALEKGVSFGLDMY